MERIDWKAKHDAIEKKLRALMVQNVDYSKGFDKFWAEYPKKQEKKLCYEKHWCKLKLTKELYTTIMQGLIDYKASHDWLKDNGKWIPKPRNFIAAEMWNDEIVPRYPSHMSSAAVVRKCEHCGTLGDGRNEIRDVDGTLWCRYCYNVCGDGCGKKCRRDGKGEK